MPRMFIFGLGYSARYIAISLESRGWEVISTGRDGTLAAVQAATEAMQKCNKLP